MNAPSCRRTRSRRQGMETMVPAGPSLTAGNTADSGGNGTYRVGQLRTLGRRSEVSGAQGLTQVSVNDATNTWTDERRCRPDGHIRSRCAAEEYLGARWLRAACGLLG